MSGDMAVVSYVRAVQSSAGGSPATGFSAETRVWQRQDGDTTPRWINVVSDGSLSPSTRSPEASLTVCCALEMSQHMHRSMLSETWP
jgi:hypothetical protein